jgi:hypothetical protein
MDFPLRHPIVPNNGWSSNVTDYVFLKQLGQCSTGIVYQCRLTDEACQRAITNGIPSSLCNGDFALKILYNFADSDLFNNDEDVIKRFQVGHTISLIKESAMANICQHHIEVVLVDFAGPLLPLLSLSQVVWFA